MTPKRIYTNKGGTAIITPPAIPLHPTDIEWMPATEIERLQAALDTARADALEDAALIVEDQLQIDGIAEIPAEELAALIRAMKAKP